MTAVTVTEISKTDLPFDRMSGTGLRRAIVAIRYTSANTSDTLALASYIPNLADIEGVIWDSMNSAVAATKITWSTTTITAAGHTGSGVGELGLMVNFT